MKISLQDGNADFVRQLVVSRDVELGLTSLWQAGADLSFTLFYLAVPSRSPT